MQADRGDIYVMIRTIIGGLLHYIPIAELKTKQINQSNERRFF